MGEGDIVDVLELDPAAPLREDELRAELVRPWSRVWVAREGGSEVVAILLSWHVEDEIHVLDVVTRVDRRRRGIGRALMDEVVRYARGAHARRILLEVRRSNAAALALYRGVGFFAFGIRARYYPATARTRSRWCSCSIPVDRHDRGATRTTCAALGTARELCATR